MLQWRGADAVSAARLSSLVLRIRDRGCAVGSLAAEFVHFIDLAGEPTPHEREVLARLPDDGSPPATRPEAAARIWVVPRLGTISPSASKATDIARSCGLARVRRIERGVLWAASGTSQARLLAAADALVDQAAQHLEDLRQQLNFVEDGQPAGLLAEEQLGIGQLGSIARPFEVQVGRGLGQVLGDHARERSLADLAGPEDGNDRRGVVLGFTFIGYAMDEVLNPKLRER